MPSRTKAPHHKGNYHVRSRAVVAAAKADPTTVCWRCGKTLHQHPDTKTGNPPKWSAGHLRDGDPTSPLLPEVLSCNARAGAILANRSPLRRKSAAWRPTPPRVTELTW
jgi:hypothetical protein